MNKSNDSNLDGWAHDLFLGKVTGIAPNIIYIFNQKTQSNEYSNRSIGESLGYTTQEIRDMGDAMFLNLCHPDDLGSIGPHFEAISQMTDGEVISLEYRMKHKDGRWVWLLGYDTVFERDESGKVFRHLGIATDISEQKNALERAEAERVATDAANAELQTFAYSMSHDMKAPSNTLRNLLEELRDQHAHTFDADANNLLDMSIKTVKRLQVRVDDVLDYTRIIGQRAEFSVVDLNETVRELFHDLQADVASSGAKLHVDTLPIVRGSAVQLRILFQNLIANALKYHPTGATPSVVVTSVHPQEDGMACVQIKDNGIGIAPEHQQKIFELFRRLHTQDEYPGTGLGLTMCRRIASTHGGDVTLESALNQGATFTVSLPKA